MKISKLAHIIAICFCILSFDQFAQSDEPGKTKTQPTQQGHTPSTLNATIRNYDVNANGNDLTHRAPYSGICPVSVNFSWILSASAPTVITYHIVRSDQTTPEPEQQVNVPKANASAIAYYTWKLGDSTAEFKDFKGSVTLVMDTPTNITAGGYSYQTIPFVLNCIQVHQTWTPPPGSSKTPKGR
ncbi:MAG: hypothetical protein ABSC77_01280 [Terracidiphilus sp.]|jgi:hypothetical protein